jgi:hypothetical protein
MCLATRTLTPPLLLPLLAGCFVAEPGLVTVVEAREVGALEQSAKIQGRDGGGSAVVWDRTVFIFGDTVLNVPDVEGETWHHNSFSSTLDSDASDGIGPLSEPLDEAGAPRNLIGADLGRRIRARAFLLRPRLRRARRVQLSRRGPVDRHLGPVR